LARCSHSHSALVFETRIGAFGHVPPTRLPITRLVGCLRILIFFAQFCGGSIQDPYCAESAFPFFSLYSFQIFDPFSPLTCRAPFSHSNRRPSFSVRNLQRELLRLLTSSIPSYFPVDNPRSSCQDSHPASRECPQIRLWCRQGKLPLPARVTEVCHGAHVTPPLSRSIPEGFFLCGR